MPEKLASCGIFIRPSEIFLQFLVCFQSSIEKTLFARAYCAAVSLSIFKPFKTVFVFEPFELYLNSFYLSGGTMKCQFTCFYEYSCAVLGLHDMSRYKK